MTSAVGGIRLLKSVYGPRRRLRYHEYPTHKVTKSQSRSTCPSLSPSPPAHSVIIGPAVINTHALGGLQIPRWLGSDHSQRSPIGLVVFGLGSCGFRGNVMIQVEDCRPRRRSWSRFPLTRSCPELFRGTGPLLSLVLRTEDVWQRYNQFGEVCGALNQGFPFSPL